MGQRNTIGIVGGYGATGKAVLSVLLNFSEGPILIGARDLGKGMTLAAELGGRVSAAHLDVLDAASLNEFCRRCSIVVNCAGPVRLLQDRVAQAAFRARSHYVDVAGLTFVKERMLAHAPEVARLGLSFVVSAGWMPGISELAPAYANSLARTRMDMVECLMVYYSDSGEWSDNAMRDAAWYLHRMGLRRAGYFHRGEWTRASISAALRKTDLGPSIGTRHFILHFSPELSEIGRQLVDCDFFAYSYLSGLRSAAAATLMGLVSLPDRAGVRLMRNLFRSNQLEVDGFVVARVLGSSAGRKSVLTVQIVYRERRDYWINALVPASVARMIAAGKSVKPGVHDLVGAVDPVILMEELKKAGVEQTETWE